MMPIEVAHLKKGLYRATLVRRSGVGWDDSILTFLMRSPAGRWLLAISLAANVILAALLLWSRRVEEPVVMLPKDAVGEVKPTAPLVPVELKVAQGGDEFPADGDAAAMVAFLRQRGMSRVFIGHFISAMMADKYGPQIAAIGAKQQKYRWDSGSGAKLTDDERRARASLRQQQQDEFEALMGEDLQSWLERTRRLSPGTDTLPVAKRATVSKINEDYASIRQQQPRIRSAEVDEKLESEWLADLAAVLTPEELQDYLTFNSPQARELQSRLRGLDLSDQQYTDIYRATEAFRQKAETDPRYAGAKPGSFGYRLEEIKAIQSAAGSAVALHVALAREQSFRQISMLYTSHGASPEEMLDRYQAWVMFHTELERVQGSVTSQRDAMTRARPIADRAYTALTAGFDAARRQAFEATETGAALVRMRKAPPTGG